MKIPRQLPQHCPGCRCFDELSDPDQDTVGAYHGRRSQAPDTEREQAYEVEPRTGTARRAVLEVFIERGAKGATDYELRHITGQHNGGPQARRHELKKGGWIEDSGRRRPTGHGGTAAVWVLTPAARLRLIHSQGC